MAKTDAELLAQADVIAEETEIGGNTKERIATMFKDIIENKTNSATAFIQPWNFTTHSGAFPSDPNKLYIATDSSVVPENTWFVAVVSDPSEFGDFLYK